jgi:YLP motif-containing protein 1
MHGQPAAQVPAGPAGLAPAAAAAPTAAPAPEAAQQPVVQQKVQLRSLLLRPGRHKRPPRLLLVLRGLPGSGKSHLARKIKEVEVEQGGSAPRVHSIDDYFMTVGTLVASVC